MGLYGMPTETELGVLGWQIKEGIIMVSVIKLTDIPDAILPAIGRGKDKNCYLRGMIIDEMFIFKNQYRIVTARGEYRYSSDTDTTIEIY